MWEGFLGVCTVIGFLVILAKAGDKVDDVAIKASRRLDEHRRRRWQKRFNKRRTEGEFVDGKREGLHITIDGVTGRKITEETWKADVAEGPLRSWWPNGAKKFEWFMKAGVKHGTQRSFDERGRLCAEGDWVHGKQDGLWTHYHPNGKKSSQGTYQGGLEEGVATYWDERGKVLQKVTFKQGQVVSRSNR